jgi:small conductance mechanosensitive channel
MPSLVVLAQTSVESACGSDPGLLCRLVFDLTDSEGLAKASLWLTRPLTVLFILLAAWFVSRIVRRAIVRTVARMLEAQREEAGDAARRAEEKAQTEPRPHLRERALKRALLLQESTERSAQRTQTLGEVMSNVGAIVIYSIAFVMALAEFDISLGPILASAGVAGVALGFGAQSVVKDFLSGIFMLIEDQYGVGDVIDVGEAAGVVEKVNLRVTQVRDIHGTLWHVPNGEIRRVGNKSQEWARAVLDVEVAYGTDIAVAMGVIKRVADEVWEEAPDNATILEEPEIWGIEYFGESAIAIRLAMKVEPAEQWTTARLVRGRLKEAFDAEGIEIPFPQRTIWFNQAPSSRPPSGIEDHAQEAFLPEAPPEEEAEAGAED